MVIFQPAMLDYWRVVEPKTATACWRWCKLEVLRSISFRNNIQNMLGNQNPENLFKKNQSPQIQKQFGGLENKVSFQ